MSDVETVEEEAVEVDEAREAMLSELTDELGGDIIESFVKPGDDVWIRVSADAWVTTCLLYTSPSPRDRQKSRMPSSA